MKITRSAFLVSVVLVSLAAVAGADPTVGARDLTADEYQRMLELVMDGRSSSAESELEALADTCAGQPLYLLAGVRLQLESIAIDDDDKTATNAIAEPAYATLEEVVRWCDAGLDADDTRLDLKFYRGWAWMVRSQIKAFSRSFYAAGRDAGKGKSDLETYLEVHPDDGIANGLLGAFLYFTDAVPDLFQFLSKLLFLPTGDRDRGLAMIGRAVAAESPARVDYEVLEAGVTFFFEGRFEDGLVKSNALLERYPRYPRLAAASAIVGPLDPLRAGAHLDRVARVVDELDGETGIDEPSLVTVRSMHGWARRILSGHDQARQLLAGMADAPPTHPDWAGSFARFQLAQMLAMEGRASEARALAQQLKDDEANTRFRDQAERMLDDLPDRGEGVADPVEDRWVAELYSGDPDSLAVLTARFDDHAATSVRAAFHAADARLIAGDRRGALRGYRDVHGREMASWEIIYRLLSAARIGELSAEKGNLRGAANWLGRAAEDHQDLYRLDWLLKGRQRYYEEIDGSGRPLPAGGFMSASP